MSPTPNIERTIEDDDAAAARGGDIRCVPYERKHVPSVLFLTLVEFPFPENLLGFLEMMVYCCYVGVVALDENDKVVAYFLGQSSMTIGLCSRKKVGVLTIVCVSSKHQGKGISKAMGKYMMDGRHPDFTPDDYDEIILLDTDAWNSPSWLFSDRIKFRYCPTYELARRFSLVGYLQLLLTLTHYMPGQFVKVYAKTDEDHAKADSLERQKGIVACLVSGILPAVYWICSWVWFCGVGGVRWSFVGWVFLSVYLLLAVRFGLAHVWARERVVFREYDNWWSPFGMFWSIAVFVGIPLLGWTGGFYLGIPGANYLHEKHRTALAKMYLPINLFTLALFALHQLARILFPVVLRWASGLPDVLGYAAFFCSISDLGMPLVWFPSGAMAVRRWSFALFAALWVCWCIVLMCGLLLPDEREDPGFLDLSVVACRSAA